MTSRLVALLLTVAVTRGAEITPMWWTEPSAPAPELGVAEGKEKVRPVRLLKLCPLETFRASPGKDWELLHKIPAVEPGLPPVWASYVRVTIPEGADKLSVLIVPGPKPQALAFELGERAHPWGTTRLVNLTPETIEGWIGKRRLRLAPGAQAASEPAKERKTEEIVLAAVKDGAQPRLLLSSRVILMPVKRSLVFLILRADGSPDTRAIEESRLLETESPPPPAGAGTRPPAPVRR